MKNVAFTISLPVQTGLRQSWLSIACVGWWCGNGGELKPSKTKFPDITFLQNGGAVWHKMPAALRFKAAKHSNNAMLLGYSNFESLEAEQTSKNCRKGKNLIPEELNGLLQCG
ncbi:hypothetical protein TNCT_326021 [Trichonephila clavata]|uniref:Uncharacterized protein n=1 Tax=Trichonephila clavata TaxID=2740835 RepID=A0A8X6EXF3_TRICU|nr:hypothetical protein TNCT_326021 [Trichonephila clavata]